MILRLLQPEEHSFALAEGLTKSAGGAFLRWLVDYLASVTGAEIVLVGEFVGLDTTSVEVRAIARRHACEPVLRYDLEPSPFQGIASVADRLLEGGIARAFPEDLFVAQAGIDAAAAVLLRDTEGRPLGFLGLMHTEGFAEPDAVMATMHLFASRLAGEIELLRAASYSRLLTEQPVGEGDAALVGLLGGVARVLRVKVAFVAELLDRDLGISRTIAMSIDGRVSENIQYAMRGTPCEYVLTSKDAFYPDGVRSHFPHDEFLAEVGAEGYYSLAFFGPDGRPLGHLGVIHDRPMSVEIRDSLLLRTLAVRAKETLQARTAARVHEQIESRLLAVQRHQMEEWFVPGVAHDLRTLVTALMGNADLLQRQGPADERAQLHVERCRKLCMRAHELIGHLMGLLGRERISIASLDVNDIVAETAELLRPSLPAGISMDLDLDASLPRVAGCPAEISQIAMNLVVNAVEACGNAGRVRIGTSCVHLGQPDIEEALVGKGAAPGRFAQISVADAGPGLPDAFRSQLFDPSFTTKGEGHGLGLAAVERAARRHRAVIQVTSSPGQGSTFRVSFPLG